MSDLTDLIEAAKAAPSSSGILRAILREAGQAVDATPAVTYLESIDPVGHDPAARAAAAGFLLKQKKPDLALSWTGGEDDALARLRVEALVMLDRLHEAADLYSALIARAPAMRDPKLDSALASPLLANPSEAIVVDLSGKPLPQITQAARHKVTFADIGGLETVKSQIRKRIISPFEKPGLYERFRKHPGGGVLLFGPPGCGKTLIARATAGEVNAHFIPVEIASVLDMYVGQSEKKLARIFAEARSRKPSVMFFDEIEALAAPRRYAMNESRASLVSAFLHEMDGFAATNEQILVLAATNVPWAVDTAFRRPGRFDRTIFIPPPDRAARRAIIALELKDRPADASVDVDYLAAATSGYSGADLRNLVETACDLAIEESVASDRISPVSQRHLSAALREVKPTTLEWLAQARNYARYANEGGLYDDVAAFLDSNAPD